ncbi:ImmA/IrrE family metallo-endopeptidase [Actinobacteria bacterium YIM 96077]|uniref:Toxin-antitoxin system, toxin component n=1 Tax=Phytoactinopolyspora halophila TaxID=1981511 RepID=A0A329QAS1_9ACTN|nr:ImmA/IrrE family metallo-endopeptidase [Phytoactinopolyspora halophila]AYY13751.1 ImmA/IrrE family metallo-endopeptidase [Actinobacteria bacterium YIM 96077]RAW09161.1 toxin-antitoxin system, toxin component [Phytoactinopolyspora halophila]
MNAEAEGRTAAERFRREHRLGVQPLGDLVAVTEQTTGFDVAILDAGPDEHGLAMRDPERDTVFIGVARTTRPMRQRSTLAHELAHVLFEDWANAEGGDWSQPSPEEDRCRSFARHLLVPVEGVREFLGDRDEVTLASLSAVVQRFLVSPTIAAIALDQAGYIDAATSEHWRDLHTPQLAARFGWTDQYRALQAESDRRRAPQRLLARAINGYALGVLHAQHIATLRGVTLEEAEADLDEAGVAPIERDVVWANASDLPDVHVDLSDLDDDLTTSDNGPGAVESDGG